MKPYVLLSILFVGSLALTTGCGLFSPASTGTIQVSNQCGCAVNASLDGGSAASVGAGGSYNFPPASVGDHTINFSTDGGACGGSNCSFQSGTSTTCTVKVSSGDLYVSRLNQGANCSFIVVTCP